jgi:putative salt-induced outer membrane protein YdiY
MPTTIVGRRLFSPVCVLLALLCTIGIARADEVLLTNGDRLTGTIVKMEDGILTLQTTYGGEIKIAWGEVQSLNTIKPITLKVPGKSNGLVSDFLIGGYDFLEVNALSPDNPVPLAHVKGINIGFIQYRGNFTLGGNDTSGNTNTTAVNGAARLTLRMDRHRLYLEAKYNYGEADEQVVARNSMAQAKYDYFITKKVFLDVFGLWEKDTFQNLQFRNTLGAGIGYQFFDTDRTTLSVSTGLGYVNEHFTTVPQTQTASSRWGVRFEHKLLPDRLTVFHRQDGFYDLGHGNGMRINADTGLRVFVYKAFYFNLEYDIRLNTQPAPGRQKLDEAFIFGIGYELK